MKRTMTRALGALATAAALTLLSGCSDSTEPAHSWTGTYSIATKFGGETGTWSDAGHLTLTWPTGVELNATQILNPTWQADTLSWTIADGNAGNARIAFKSSSSATYYWDAPVEGKLFEGAYQNPGEGWVDFRGIVD